MKFTDDIIKKVGYDKLIHMSFSGWIISIVTTLTDYWVVILLSIILVMAMCYTKEMLLDNKADYKDVLWSAIGICISTIVYYVGGYL